MIGVSLRTELIHEGDDAVDTSQRRRHPATKPRDEGGLVRSLSAETSGRHPSIQQELVDALDEVGFCDHLDDAVSGRKHSDQVALLAMDENDVAVRMCEIANAMASPEEEPLLYRKLMAVKPIGMTPNRWLTEAGVNRSFFTTLRSRGNANWQTVEKLLSVAGLTPDQFGSMQAPGTDRSSIEDEGAAKQLPFLRDDEERRDIPMLGTALGADFEVSDDGTPQFAEVTDLHLDEVVDHLRRPVSLRNRPHLYGLSVVGASMSPRFEPGDPAYIDPKATPRIGDDVVVYLRKPEGDEGERVFSVLLKRLVKRSAAFVELEQFNPPIAFRLDTKCIARIDRVIPWREIAIF